MKDFDLNDRIQKAWKNNGGTSVVNGFPEAFSVKTGNHLQSPVSENTGNPSSISLIHQLFMYLGTFIGVLLSTAVNHFVNAENFELTVTLGEVVLSAVVALIIIPLVYEKLMLNPKAPLIVQFGIFVQNGVFWHVLIESIGSAV